MGDSNINNDEMLMRAKEIGLFNSLFNQVVNKEDYDLLYDRCMAYKIHIDKLCGIIESKESLIESIENDKKAIINIAKSDKASLDILINEKNAIIEAIETIYSVVCEDTTIHLNDDDSIEAILNILGDFTNKYTEILGEVNICKDTPILHQGIIDALTLADIIVPNIEFEKIKSAISEHSITYKENLSELEELKLENKILSSEITELKRTNKALVESPTIKCSKCKEYKLTIREHAKYVETLNRNHRKELTTLGNDLLKNDKSKQKTFNALKSEIEELKQQLRGSAKGVVKKQHKHGDGTPSFECPIVKKIRSEFKVKFESNKHPVKKWIYEELSNEYKVNMSTIERIVLNKTYKQCK